MERGTEWEREAIRERWEAMERKQALTTRLLWGLTLAGGGFILLLLALSRDVCRYTIGGGKIRCTQVAQWPHELIFGPVGGIGLAIGIWICLTVFKAE